MRGFVTVYLLRANKVRNELERELRNIYNKYEAVRHEYDNTMRERKDVLEENERLMDENAGLAQQVNRFFDENKRLFEEKSRLENELHRVAVTKVCSVYAFSFFFCQFLLLSVTFFFFCLNKNSY